MKLHDLKPTPGSHQKKIRRGRGDASGYGSFSGRGVKGQNARTGGGVRIGFEGGQTPILRRTPKLKGFKNPNRVETVIFNLSEIEENYADGEIVSPDTLREKKLMRKNSDLPVKILGNGKLTKKVTFQDVAFSKSVQKLTGAKPTKSSEATEQKVVAKKKPTKGKVKSEATPEPKE